RRPQLHGRLGAVRHCRTVRSAIGSCRLSVAGSRRPVTGNRQPTIDNMEVHMNRVTGIGGIFFKCKDPKAMQAWYKRHLGIDVQDWGGAAFRWTDADGKPLGGTTAWLIEPA